jgi:hypothetical protein
MTKYVLLSLVAAMTSALIFAALGSAAAQNVSTGGNMSAGTNVTNATAGGNMTGGNATTSSSSASTFKMHLEEGIKALQNGDKQGAMTHLSAAQQAMSGVSAEAIKHFEEGMKALSGGDIKGAIMHLQFADQALG